MQRRDLIFIICVVSIVAFLYVISINRLPRIPNDASHVEVRSEPICLDCHGRGKPAELPANHPNKMQCFRCHLRQK